MPENPFLIPPQVPSPASRSWGLGFAFGFQTAPVSATAPANFSPEDPDAFNLGVLAGQQSAIEGLAVVPQECVDLNRVPPAALEFVSSGFEVITIGKEIAKEIAKKAAESSYGGAIFGAILLFVELSMALETHFDDPREAVAHNATVIQETLQEMGIQDSMELFIGGAIDTSFTGCELKLTPVFRTLDAARFSAQSIGRPELLIAKWRTDQSGGLKVVESA